MRFAAVGTKLLRLCFPPRCLGCGMRLPIDAPFELICRRCFGSMPRRWCLSCPLCRARVPGFRFRANGRLPACHPQAAYVLAAASEYRDRTVRSLIQALKYRPVRRAALPLAELLAEYIVRLGDTLPPGMLPLVPVPLHPKRERERGWNQAAVLAGELAKLMPGRFAVRDDLIRRVRYTEPQVKVRGRNARMENILDVFEAERSASGVGPILVLIDDVVTTGATLADAARTLRRAGVRTVIGLVVAAA